MAVKVRKKSLPPPFFFSFSFFSLKTLELCFENCASVSCLDEAQTDFQSNNLNLTLTCDKT